MRYTADTDDSTDAETARTPAVPFVMLAGAFLLVSALDLLTTIVGLQAGLVESNGVPAELYAEFGVLGLSAGKLLSSLGVVAAAWMLWGHWWRYSKTVVTAVMSFGVVVTGIAVINNCRLLLGVL